MSTPNPLIPQGSLAQKAGHGGSNVRIAVATIVAIHVVFFGGLLLQGCKRDAGSNAPEETVAETNQPAAFEYPPMTGSASDLYYDSPSELPRTETNYAATPTPQPGDAAPGISTSSPTPREATPAPAADSSRLFVPLTNYAATPAPQPEVKEYTVVRGDSFYEIAREHGITTRALMDANPGIEPARLQIGAILKVPAPEPASSKPAADAAEEGQIYTVKSGDTLSRIARRHGVRLSDLREANNLRTSRILVGQKLRIPEPEQAANGTPAQ